GGVVRAGAVVVTRRAAADVNAISALRLRVRDLEFRENLLLSQVSQEKVLFPAKLPAQLNLPIFQRHAGGLDEARNLGRLGRLLWGLSLVLCQSVPRNLGGGGRNGTFGGGFLAPFHGQCLLEQPPVLKEEEVPGILPRDGKRKSGGSALAAKELGWGPVIVFSAPWPPAFLPLISKARARTFWPKGGFDDGRPAQLDRHAVNNVVEMRRDLGHG